MIKEIGTPQLVSYLAKRAGKDKFSCTYNDLRKIADHIERSDQTIRVELGERNIHAFRSRSVRHISIKDGIIEVEGLNSPIMQSIIRQYTPHSQVVSLIEEAIKK